MSALRSRLKTKKRIIVKIGSASLIDPETDGINHERLEELVKVLVHLKRDGKDVCLVSSGAIAVGSKALGMSGKPDSLPKKQAYAAVGQAKLIQAYDMLFEEAGTMTGQVLLTAITLENSLARANAVNTFEELFKLGVIPVVNENDSISTEEIEQVHTFGDNDRLSALVAQLTGADLLILLSDIDGMYTDDPKSNSDAGLISEVEDLTDEMWGMAKGTDSKGVGTGGMSAKLAAAKIAVENGADMLILNGNNPENIKKALAGEDIGTLFLSK